MATKPASSPSKLSTNSTIAVATGVVIVVLLICAYFGYVLGQKLITNSKVALAQAQASSQLNTKLDNAQTLVGSYQALGSKTTLIGHALPVTPDFPALISIMENAAASSGVTLVSVTPSLTETATATPVAAVNLPAGAQAYDLTLQVTGSYPKVVAFMKNLELSSRPMRVTNIQVTGTDQQLSVTLSVTTFFAPKANIDDKQEQVK